MTYRVTIKPLASADLDDIADYISENSLQSALRFLEAAENTFEKLAEMPLMGSPRKFSRPELSGIRFFPVHGFQNFLVFYIPIESGIDVVRVIHGARDIPTLFEMEIENR